MGVTVAADGAVTLHCVFWPQIEFLSAAGHRVIAPDLPGFGRSDKPQELDTYKLENLAEVNKLTQSRHPGAIYI